MCTNVNRLFKIIGLSEQSSAFATAVVDMASGDADKAMIGLKMVVKSVLEINSADPSLIKVIDQLLSIVETVGKLTNGSNEAGEKMKEGLNSVVALCHGDVETFVEFVSSLQEFDNINFDKVNQYSIYLYDLSVFKIIDSLNT